MDIRMPKMDGVYCTKVVKEQYPEIKEKIITLQPKNVYFTKQLECLFENNDGVSDFIEYKFQSFIRHKTL